MEGCLSWLRCAVCATIVLGGGGAAYGQMDYRLTVGLAGLASDNPASQPTGAPTEADASVAFRGGVDLGYLGSLATDRLSYTIMATRWIRDTQSPALTQVLRLFSEIQVTPATRVSLSAGATLSHLGLSDTISAASLPTTGPQPTDQQPTNSQTSSPQQVGPQPAGNQEYLTLDARESVAWQPNGQWRVDQGLGGSAYRPLGGGSGSIDNEALTLDIGLAKLWQHDSAGVRGRLGTMMTSGSADQAQPSAGSDYTELAESSLVWEHQWNAAVAHELSAGMIVVRSDQVHPVPTASATVTWRRPGYTLTGRLAQTADYSVMIGSALQRRMASLATALPVNRFETMRLIASACVEHDSLVAATDGLGGSIDVFDALAGLGWQPGDTFAYSLAYSFRDQWATETGGTISAFSAFHRQSIMATVAAAYGGIF